MKKTVILVNIVVFLMFSINSAQSIKGNLSQLAKQEIKLEGFNGLESYFIAKTTLDEKGNFSLTYNKEDIGMGYLISADSKPLFVILSGDDINLQGENLTAMERLRITKNAENIAFETYAKNQPKREQALSAWIYLEKLYRTDSLFAREKTPKQAITKEIARINAEDAAFINNLPDTSYVKWLLPIRKLVSNVATVAQYRTDEIPATLTSLRNINYADARLYKSGLLKEAIENHIWFIENSSGPLDSVFKDLNSSIDLIIAQLKNDNEKFNLIAAKMFEVLEERSLFASAEYLAKKLLEDDDCGCLNPEFEKRMQKYGAMAEGETALDIDFGEFTYTPEGVNAKKLSEIDADYKLVVFAAGWCSHCTEDLPKIAAYYLTLKQKNVQVLLVSLDTNKEDFANFAAGFPFISTTDYKKWDGQAALDYQVYATPSYFLLDRDLKIVKRLISADHVKAVIASLPN